MSSLSTPVSSQRTCGFSASASIGVVMRSCAAGGGAVVEVIVIVDEDETNLVAMLKSNQLAATQV